MKHHELSTRGRTQSIVLALGALVAVAASGCVGAIQQSAGSGPLVLFPGPVATFMVVPVHDPVGNLPTNLRGWLTPWDGTPAIEGQNRPDGVGFITTSTGGSSACFEADGLAKTCVDLTIERGVIDQGVTMKVPHVDPSTLSLNQLAAIRGAMWGTRWDGAYGPRPGQPDNILATDFYGLYPASERARMLDIYVGRGYTHAVMGPFSGTNCYHDDYPCHEDTPGSIPYWGAPTQAQWDFFLERAQELWDRGIAPIVFIHPDGWTFEQTRDAFTPLLAQPRAQHLVRIVVPSGWEPTLYDWSSCTWARYAQWARQTLPNALVLLHTVSDVDAPVGVDDLCNDNNNPNGNGDGWARVAPYIHGWLIQNGPYPAAPAQDDEHRQPFCEQFNPEVPHTVAWEFVHNGWPQFSAWGNGIRIRLYNAENTAYSSYWRNLPEDASRDWGDLAMSCGADGYLDGGRVAVPVR